MDGRRWFNSSQPQTLQFAQILLYFNGVLLLLQGMIRGGLGLFGLAFLVGQVGGAFGIANDRKWGYWVAVVFAFAPLIFELYLLRAHVLAVGAVTLLFQVALIFMLLHPQSREYKRIWFR
jgi:uncharacterized membrane protein (DUF2068 family)